MHCACSRLCASINDDQLLTASQRGIIEARLRKFDIPFQILQMVAKGNNCLIDIDGNKGKSIKKVNLERILPMMNNKSLVELQQIFVECQDAFSHFRFAVYLSSMYNSVRYKFVINENVSGVSNDISFFDVCIYSRETGSLVAVGAQNNDIGSRPADDASIQHFLKTVVALSATAPTLSGAYYASSYGYKCDFQSIDSFWSENRKQKGQDSDGPLELKLLEYKDKVYFELKLPSQKSRSSAKLDKI